MDSKSESLNKAIASIIEAIESDDSANLNNLILQFPNLANEIRSFFEDSKNLENMIKSDLHSSEDRIFLNSIPGIEVIQKIGSGSVGTVYKARQTQLGRNVAIKILPKTFLSNPTNIKRLKFETSVASCVNDSQILPVFDVIIHEQRPIIVFPFIDGCNLQEIINLRKSKATERTLNSTARSWKNLSLGEYTVAIKKVFCQIAQAVSRIHELKILHQDIKPSNILIDENGNAWLSDFGISQSIDACRESKFIVKGTMRFICPESFDSDENLEFSSDVFSLGVTFFLAFSLCFPFKNPIVSSFDKITAKLTDINSHLDNDTSKIIEKAISPNKYARFQSGKELFTALSTGKVKRKEKFNTARFAIFGLPFLITFVFSIYLLTYTNTNDSGSSKTPLFNVTIETNPPGRRRRSSPLGSADRITNTNEKSKTFSNRRSTSGKNVAPGKYLVVVNRRDMDSMNFIESSHQFRHVSRSQIFPTDTGKENPKKN